MKKLLLILFVILPTLSKGQNIISVSDTNVGYLFPREPINTFSLANGVPYEIEDDIRRGNNYPKQGEGVKIYGIAGLLRNNNIPDSVEIYAFFFSDTLGCIAVDSMRIDTVRPTSFFSVEHSGTNILVPLYEVFFDRGYFIDNSRFSVAIGLKNRLSEEEYLNSNTSTMYARVGFFYSLSEETKDFHFRRRNVCDAFRTVAFYGAIPIIDSTLRIRHETMLTCGNIGKLRADYTDTRVFTLHWGDTNQHCLYQVAYGPANLPFDSYTIFETTDTNFILSGLSFGERYAFRVRPKCCFNDSLSIWKPWSDTVQFERPYYSVSVHANNNAWGHVLGNGRFEQNSLVTIEARPADSCSFCRWDDGDTSSIRQLTLVCDTSLIAIFEYHPDTSGNGTQAIVTNNDNNITVAPNPTKASVIIASPYPMFSIGLYDTRGLKVLQLDNCGTCADIDLSTLPEGTYTASILTSQGHYSRKIVKR